MANRPSPAPMSGGFLIAIALIVGVVAGMIKGEASFGFLVGLGVGVALALAVWALDKRRGN